MAITINGTIGNDIIANNSGNDLVVFADNGDDKIATGNGHDFVDGGAGNDTMSTGNGNDTVIGGEGNDKILAGNGNDFVDGGEGADNLNGGTGYDTLSYEGSSAGVNVNLSAGGSSQSATGGDATGDTIFGFEHVIGSAHNDTLRGSGVANSLIGGAGDDSISGLHGSDVISDGVGNDTVVGGVGADNILLAVDGETDLIIIGPGDGADTISGFDIDAPNAGAGEGDLLDISDLLVGFAGADLNAAVNPANQFVNLLASGTDLLVQVDADGGVGGPFTTVATLVGLSAATAADLNDNIIVT
jgi:Ca2+-binding RTX toxin-like protein